MKIIFTLLSALLMPLIILGCKGEKAAPADQSTVKSNNTPVVNEGSIIDELTGRNNIIRFRKIKTDLKEIEENKNRQIEDVLKEM